MMKADRAISPRWPQRQRQGLTSKDDEVPRSCTASTRDSQAQVVRQARCACAFQAGGWAAGQLALWALWRASPKPTARDGGYA